jgi:hypothetical protein
MLVKIQRIELLFIAGKIFIMILSKATWKFLIILSVCFPHLNENMCQEKGPVKNCSAYA